MKSALSPLLLATCTTALLHHPILPRHHQRHTSPLLVQTTPEKETKPNLPPPTEDGGPLADILPLSLLLQSQPADRSNDPMVGEDAATYAWKNEKWGEAAVLPGQPDFPAPSYHTPRSVVRAQAAAL